MQTLKRHAGYWLVIYLLWTYLKSGGDITGGALLLTLVYISILMMVYYLLTKVQIPRWYNQGKTGLFVISLLGSSLFFTLLWTGGMLSMDSLLGERYSFPRMSPGAYLLESVQLYSPTVALLAWESYAAQQREQERIELLEKEKIKNELKFLKAQLNPHFLFNTLQNLHTKVIEKSKVAPDMILSLSAILDYVLYKSQQKTVSLREEITAIEHFLKLEQIHCGESLEIIFNKGEQYKLQIAPLVLLSLIEEVFKIVSFSEMENPKIKIEIKEVEKNIYCAVKYTSRNEKETLVEKTEGKSFESIRHRLSLSYPGQHEFLIKEESAEVKIILSLKRRILIEE